MRHAVSTGPKFPIAHDVAARDEVKFAVIIAAGLNKKPFTSTGITVDKPGRAKLVSIPIRAPPLIIPASKSSHSSLLPPVYGAGPYSASHHNGIAVKPSISHGDVCGRIVS